MDVASPQAHDRFELDRLAEELAKRELSKPAISTGTGNDTFEVDGTQVDLPSFEPLGHKNRYLTVPEFDVEQFLLSRAKYADLNDLRTELREYLGALKEELVQLINDDYEAFISLSTDLRGEGRTLERLQRPLGDLRKTVSMSRDELQDIQVAIEERLQQRAALREEKAFVHLLLKISESVTRLESLLLISSSESDEGTDGRFEYELNGLKEDEPKLEQSRSSRIKHLSRVAFEYTQLLYHVSKARNEQSAFVDEIQWRIDRIKSTLSSDLDHIFSTTVLGITEGKDDRGTVRMTESEKPRLMTDLTECLKTYDVLGLWRDAEDVLRRDVVRDFVKKNIYSGALTAPHSPILPHTPFVNGFKGSPSTVSQPPRTPWTPYTAFASKQNPFEFTFGAAAAGLGSGGTLPGVPLLDDTDDPLAGLFNIILKFVDRDLKGIMEAAERVCVKSGSRPKPPAVSVTLSTISLEKPSKKGNSGAFDIMANVIWAEISRAIMDELGGIIFSAGKPDEFRKHHETTQAFVRALEFLAPSIEAIEAMRAHSSYSAFERRWQLPVYFQIRWKDIVGKLEVALSVTRLEAAVLTDGSSFVTLQTAALWTAISSCWSAEVYIPELSSRFWKFTLQLISRYRSWLEASLPPLEVTSNLNGALNDRAGTPTTPSTNSEATSETTAADNVRLRQFTIALVDIRALCSQFKTLWDQEICVMLPDAQNAAHSAFTEAQAALNDACESLTSLNPPLINQCVSILTKQCCDATAPVKMLPAQVRMNKKSPTEPSSFVPSILRPVKTFFGIQTSETLGASLREEHMRPFAEQVFDGVCKRYHAQILAWRKAEESLRRINRGQRVPFSLFGSSRPAKDDKARDDERIRMQMTLDVEALGKDATSLGVKVEEAEVYRTLLEIATAPIAGDES